MPSPNRLAQRIAKIWRCHKCQSSELPDWLWNEEQQGRERCGCLRGRLLRISDRIREGHQIEETEMELLK